MLGGLETCWGKGQHFLSRGVQTTSGTPVSRSPRRRQLFRNQLSVKLKNNSINFSPFLTGKGKGVSGITGHFLTCKPREVVTKISKWPNASSWNEHLFYCIVESTQKRCKWKFWNKLFNQFYIIQNTNILIIEDYYMKINAVLER